MRLIRCYIENFGTFTKESFEFDRGITQFCKENGWGKTTLSDFITAMFYGLPAARKNSLFNERQRYYPFNGGKFGGNLEFEQDGHAYRIERFFDAKSETKDPQKVYRDTKEIPVLNGDIGQRFFGFDRATFQRLLFIGTEDVTFGVTEGISAKLGKDLDAADEGYHYDAAVEVLEKRKKELKADKGKNDEIHRLEGEIARLRGDIHNLTQIQKKLEREYTARGVLEEELSRLKEEEARFHQEDKAREQWKTFDAFQEEAVKAQGALAELKGKYKDGLPGEDTVQQVGTLIKERDTELLTREKKDPEDALRLQTLHGVFEKSIPTPQEMEKWQREGAELTRMRGAIDHLTRETASAATPENILSAEQAQTLKTLAKAYREQRDKRSTFAMNAAEKPVHPKWIFPLLIFGALSMISGAALTVFSPLAGGIAMGVGALVALMGCLGLVKSKQDRMRAKENTLSAMDRELAGLAEDMKHILLSYGYKEGDVLAFCDLSLEKREEAMGSAAYSQQQKEEAFKLLAKAEAAEQALLLEMGQWIAPEENGEKTLARLIGLTEEYTRLLNQDCAYEAKLEASIARVAAIEKELAAYTNGAPNPETLLKEWEADLHTHRILREKAEEAEKRLVAFQQEHRLTQRPPKASEGAEKLSGLRDAKQRELADCDRRILGAERDVEELADLQKEVENKEEQLAVTKERLGILEATINHLKAAEGALKDRYVAPVRDRFLYYAEKVANTLGESIRIDGDFKLLYEDGGELREERHLSSGQRTVCAILYRLSLADNMYKGEKPPVILDDPFSTVDGAYMEKLSTLLRELGKERQIVYFCCHESRKIQ